MRTRSLTALLATGILLSCENGTVGDDPMRFFLFDTRGAVAGHGQFVAATSDPVLLGKIRGQLALPESERVLHIHGRIARGNGGHNLDWSWHFVPDQWDIVEISIELCDGRPQGVEDNLDYWIENVRSFCPWSSYVVAEVEHP